MHAPPRHRRHAFSVVELLAMVTILGIIAAIVVPRLAISSEAKQARIDHRNQATINAAVERWYVEKGTWPAENLADIGADANYFPQGLPTNPQNGAAYTIDPATHHCK